MCVACQFGKQHRQPFPKERNISKGILSDVIHSNVWGPTQTTTFGGCRYYVTFIHDFSRHTWIFLTRQKSEVFTHFQKFKSEAEKATNRHVRCLRSDKGKENFFDAFTTYLNSLFIMPRNSLKDKVTWLSRTRSSRIFFRSSVYSMSDLSL